MHNLLSKTTLKTFKFKFRNYFYCTRNVKRLIKNKWENFLSLFIWKSTVSTPILNLVGNNNISKWTL